MRQGRDPHDKMTEDLLSWTPPAVIRRYDEHRVRTSTLRARIATAVAETLRDYAASRDDIAAAMSEWLEESVTKNMLDAYASEGREDHTIPFIRLLALIHVTGDVRLLQIGAEMFGHLVVDDRFLGFIELGMKFERGERLQRRQRRTGPQHQGDSPHGPGQGVRFEGMAKGRGMGRREFARPREDKNGRPQQD